jgi:hypothetical protein
MDQTLSSIKLHIDSTSAISSQRPAVPAVGSGMRFWQGAAVFAVASAILFLVSTRHGIGILPDSTRYMGLDPEPYDAPMYAWVLQGIAATGLQIEFGAKLVGLLLACANPFLIWLILARGAANYLYASVGTAIVVFSPHFVFQHSLAMSEPFFVFSILVSLLTLVNFLETEKRTWLIGCGLAVGATALVRFTGVPLGAAIACFLLLNSHRHRVQRFVDAGLVAVVSGTIFVTWALLAKLVAGHATGRDLEFYGNLDAEKWLEGLSQLSILLMPAQVPMTVRIALFLVIVAGCTYLCLEFIRRSRRTNVCNEAYMLAVVLGLFSLFYAAFVALAALLEANLFLTGRYAFPLNVTTIMLMTVVLANAKPAGRHLGHLRKAFAGVAILVLAMHAVRTADRTQRAYAEGIGYASLSWSTSPIIEAVRKLPADAQIFTNGADAIGYVLKRRSNYVPWHFLPRTGRDDPANPFEKKVEDLRRQLASGNTFVVFLDRVDWRFYMVSEEDLQKFLNLELVDKEADGRIYALPASLQDV